MAREPGRNDPCPCGSGRKYKHCCLKAHDGSDFLWRQLRAAEGRLVPQLLQLALKEFGEEFVGAALDEFFLWDGVPEDYDHTDEFSSFFVPWFVYEFVDDPGDPERVANAPDEALAAVHLRRHSDRLSPIEHAFLTSASTSPLTFYAVTKAVAGREIALHDVLTGRDVVVREEQASQTVQPGVLLFTRVVTADGVSIMSGCAPLVIPPRWHHSLLDFRERFAGTEGRMLTPEAVRSLDFELRDLYFYIEDQVWNPLLPEVRNTDGDKLVLTTVTYRLHCSPASAFDRLRPLARASGEDSTRLLSDATMNAAGELQAVSFPWNKRNNRQHKDWDNTTLGTIEIDGDRLQVHVNSERRSKRIEREIAKRLGADAVLERKLADLAEKLLAERNDERRDPLADAEQERLAQQPEVQEYMRQMGQRHWDAWLDTRLPALGNRTPREAAQTPAGRERLEALLAEFAWTAERTPNPMSPDVPALRARLGLP
jgi:SEC-C motif